MPPTACYEGYDLYGFTSQYMAKLIYLLLSLIIFNDSEWMRVCLDHWDSIPNCQFWNSQWASVTARVIKNYNFIDWQCFLPTLYSRYLNMFEVSLIFVV